MSAYLHHGRVAFHETDAAGIVHFANYFRYAEEAETHALASLGFLTPAAAAAGVHLPRVKVQAQYHHPLRFWAAYEVRAQLSSVGESSLQWVFELVSEGKLCACVSWVTARRNKQGQKYPYSEEERAQLQQLLP